MRDSNYHWFCDHIVIVSILITDILKMPSVTGVLLDINGLEVIMYEPQSDVYISDLDKHTKSNGSDSV